MRITWGCILSVERAPRDPCETSALPGGGRLDIVGSEEPGYFEELVEDRVR
jgi:hypothetical protein